VKLLARQLRFIGNSGQAFWSQLMRPVCAESLSCGILVSNVRSPCLEYKGVRLDCGYRLDLLVAGLVIVEIKSVEALAPIHEAQLLTYLKLTGVKIGLLINFNVVVLKSGIRRLVH